MQLLYGYWQETGRVDAFTDTCYRALTSIVNVMLTEQRHMERSPYRFVRDTDKETETLQNDGRGLPVNYTGMTWSGFRPSDDACLFGYNIPNNMFVTDPTIPSTGTPGASR